MSDLTITNAGVSITPKSGGNSGKGYRKIIRINPTVTTSAYAANDAIFNSIEIPNAVYGEGGVSRLESVTVRVETGSGTGGGDMVLLFSQKAQANLNDSLSSAVDITVDEVKDSKVLGTWLIDASDNGDVINGTNVISIGHASAGNGASNCLYLKAEEGSTSVYVSGIATGTWTATATDGLELIFHIEY
tara:strand:+ start:78 stop:644 length:567 start_codon:yes stop_codon:yes gene_type:complete